MATTTASTGCHTGTVETAPAFISMDSAAICTKVCAVMSAWMSVSNALLEPALTPIASSWLAVSLTVEAFTTPATIAFSKPTGGGGIIKR